MKSTHHSISNLGSTKPSPKNPLMIPNIHKIPMPKNSFKKVRNLKKMSTVAGFSYFFQDPEQNSAHNLTLNANEFS